MLDDLLVDFDLALHNVTRLEDWRLEVVALVLELYATQTHRVIIFEKERY
jgi:hypothetical protein